MCDPALEAVTSQVVTDKVNAREMFTAHDITLEVRQRGHFAKHNDIRDVVHDLYGRGVMGVDYTKTNITVPGGTPILYFPQSSDPHTYSNVRGGSQSTPTSTSGGSTSSPGQIQVPPADDGDDDDDDDDDGTISNTAATVLAGSVLQLPPVSANNGHVRRKTSSATRPSTTGVKGKGVDGRRSLVVPNIVVKTANFPPLTKVHACTDPSKPNVLVVTGQPGSGNQQVIAKYTVNRSQNIRITQSCLKKAGLGGSRYDVEVGSNELQVKLA